MVHKGERVQKVKQMMVFKINFVEGYHFYI